MSEILSNIVIEQTSINFSPDNNNLTITPEPTQLNIFTGGLAVPGGNLGELQYNNGTLAGIPNVTYTSGNLSLGNVSNIQITGGANNYFLKTDGNGNLAWAVGGGVGNSTQGQLIYNDANAATGVPNTSVSGGTLTFTNLANLKINGGTNGYVLQTDGVGNLSWTAQTGGGGGNGTPGGSNTQIQYNDSGSFGGASGFTFDESSNLVSMPGNLNILGTYIGNASGLTNIPGANVTGTVANAAYAANAGNANISNTATSATTAGTVTTASQPNITSVGTLVSLSVSGNSSAANVIASPGAFYGNGTGLFAIPGANVTGTVANANYATTAGTATNANTANFANSAGTANTATFATTAGSANIANSATTAGTVTTNAQPNITSVGQLTTLAVIGDAQLSGLTVIRVAAELINLSSGNTITLTSSGQSILYNNANATANVDLRITTPGLGLGASTSLVATYIMRNGATPYQVSSVSVDSNPVGVYWAGGSSPTTYANSLMSYTFTLLKLTDSPATYTVLGSGTAYA